ncbi:serine hydrolase domain-containing protein [Leucobacter musarum]|uniref:serine hydrolase domain-containing protein n=1 Tax=Leucobacter musarum TaxID=1930747 RepID=UPI0006A7A3BE|nr:serine hydrolase domain-containing protein [Leucobacter musarum]
MTLHPHPRKTLHSRSVRRAARAIPALVIAATLVACGNGSSAPQSGAGDAVAETGSSSAAVERPAAPEGELPTSLQQQLEAALEATMQQYGVPGAAAGVWIDGEGSWTAASGVADVDAKSPVSTDMVWPIRSITKSYTVTLILQLADAGKLNLDDTIDQYVDGVTNGDRITLLELANMSSGNADYVNDAFVADFATHPDHVYTIDELNAFVIDQPAQFEPGSEYLYTNANTNLLGAVVEKVTGKPYAEALNEMILSPLEQSGTTYLGSGDDWAAPHATGYIPKADGLEPQDETPSILGAAGALFSTLDDGRVWAQTLGSGALLDPATQELRRDGHAIPKPPYDTYGTGMGHTGDWWGHNGEGLGFTAATFFNPDLNASIVVYMNASNVDAGHPADAAFRALAKVVESQE